MDTSKIIKGAVSSGRYTVTAPIVKEDYGLYLQIEGVELPSTYEVDFSNSENSGTSVTVIGNADGVLIPRQFIDSGKDIFAFLYHVGADFGRTVYKFRIPNKLRPDRTNEQPTPEEQSVIDQAISALNSAVAQTAQDVIDADASAQSASADADRAEEARTDAQNYANNAQTSANNASASASQASASASASANSASQSAQIKADVEDLADDAQASASASAQSATASANSASQASASATSASQSATSAQGYASSAQTSANTASAKAQDASGYASTASTKASESAQSASLALTYKTDAESAKTASQTAQGLAESARDSAVQAKTDAEQAKADAESARDEAQQAVASISGALADKAPVITDMASGSIASFSDGADDLPLKSLVVDINPVQDLHGYDSPWPAGGGKNKLAPLTLQKYKSLNGGWTWNDNIATVNDITLELVMKDGIPTGEYKITGTASANTNFYLTRTDASPYAGMILNGIPSGTVNRWEMYFALQASPYTSWGYDLGNGVTLSDSASGISMLVLRLKNGATFNDVFKPMIRIATETDPTFAPYSNICPISGRTGAKLTRTGKNLLSSIDETRTINGITWTKNADGSVTLDGTATANSVYDFGRGSLTLKAGTYTTKEQSSGDIWLTVFHIANGSASVLLSGGGTFTLSQTESVFIRYFVASGKTVSKTIYPQLELGSTATDYEPYTGRSITIDLGQTVYGGKLDVLTGELTVDRAMVDLGTLTFFYVSSTGVSVFRSNIGANPVTDVMQHGLTSIYPFAQTRFTSQMPNVSWMIDSQGRFFVRDDSYSDVTTFKTAVTGQTLVYELAEPITIQLTPHEVNSLPGVNNLWANSGDTTAEYRADTKLYIQKKIAEAISALS